MSNPQNQLLLIIQQSNQFINTTLASQPCSTQNQQSSTMAFFKTLFIASVAAVAFAAPQGGASDGNKEIGIDSKTGEAKCGNGQKLACCNQGEELLGLNCISVPIRK